MQSVQCSGTSTAFWAILPILANKTPPHSPNRDCPLGAWLANRVPEGPVRIRTGGIVLWQAALGLEIGASLTISDEQLDRIPDRLGGKPTYHTCALVTRFLLAVTAQEDE